MNIGTTELIVILALALFLYGKNLPEITRTLGKAYREFRKNFDGIKKDIQEQVENIASDIDVKRADKVYSQPELPPPVSTATSEKNKDKNANLAG